MKEKINENQKMNVMEKEIKELVKERVTRIEKQEEEVVKFLEKNPNYLEIKMARDREEIHQKVQELESIYEKILPFIKNIKQYVKKN